MRKGCGMRRRRKLESQAGPAARRGQARPGQGRVASAQLGWGGARPLRVARGVLCPAPSSFDGAQCPQGSMPPLASHWALLPTLHSQPSESPGVREAKPKALDLKHLAEARRSFLLLRGGPSSSQDPPGPLGGNLHSPLGMGMLDTPLRGIKALNQRAFNA